MRGCVKGIPLNVKRHTVLMENSICLKHTVWIIFECSILQYCILHDYVIYSIGGAFDASTDLSINLYNSWPLLLTLFQYQLWIVIKSIIISQEYNIAEYYIINFMYNRYGYQHKPILFPLTLIWWVLLHRLQMTSIVSTLLGSTLHAPY